MQFSLNGHLALGPPPTCPAKSEFLRPIKMELDMNNLFELNTTTDKFFNLHWPLAGNFGIQPTWKKWEKFLCNSVPNHEKGGCYALFEGDLLIYVGKGVGKGGGATPYHGISRRLSSHVLRSYHGSNNYLYELKDKWVDISDIYTIGFDNESEYLAHSLENFLIRKLTPPKNLHL
jgi:hypothetical protein